MGDFCSAANQCEIEGIVIQIIYPCLLFLRLKPGPYNTAAWLLAKHTCMSCVGLRIHTCMLSRCVTPRGISSCFHLAWCTSRDRAFCCGPPTPTAVPTMSNVTETFIVGLHNSNAVNHYLHSKRVTN